MFLYELAIELGQRSTDVVDVAAQLGLGELGPGSPLEPHQVEALRARLGHGYAPAVAPPPPVGSYAQASPLGAAPLTPMPAAHQAPPPPPPPPPPAPVGMGGTPAPPASPYAGPDAPLVAPPPGPGWSPVAPPPGAPTFLPPTAPGPAPAAPPPAWPGGPASPDAGGRGMGRGQIAALVAVGVLVVGLFAFMALNTGPDKARQEAIRAQDESATTVTFAAPPTTTTTTTVPVTTTTTTSPNIPRNAAVFCEGARAVTAFELRSVADRLDQDFASMRARLATARASWEAGAAKMQVGAPPTLDASLATYVRGYKSLFDAVASSPTPEELRSRLDVAGVQAASAEGERIGTAVRSAC